MLLSRSWGYRCIMTETANVSRQQYRKPRPEKRQKRPQLTHFLCLPLVNTKSQPQLEESLAAFKTAHLAERGPATQSSSKEGDTFRLGLPSAAFRPLGTIHLTLGVMSLTSKERLDQALAFFQSLDLADVMNEAERVTAHTPQNSTLQLSSPLTISLESLHALPQGKSATILHASPVDPTGRLLPFCVKLRDKFIEAGFIQNELERRPAGRQNNPRFVQDSLQASGSTTVSSDASINQQESQNSSEPPDVSKNPDPSIPVITREPKPRPLLLHATLVNTIYVNGRRGQNKDTNGKYPPKRLTFDARNLISQYRNYYADDNRTIPHPAPAGSSEDTESVRRHTESSPIPDADIISSEHKSHSATSLPRGYPFIWAKEIPLDTICICEMGAKELYPGVNDDHGLNERLGGEYTVVAERSLNP
jgi:activating signal cointegrator complex subunit 1